MPDNCLYRNSSTGPLAPGTPRRAGSTGANVLQVGSPAGCPGDPPPCQRNRRDGHAVHRGAVRLREDHAAADDRPGWRKFITCQVSTAAPRSRRARTGGGRRVPALRLPLKTVQGSSTWRSRCLPRPAAEGGKPGHRTRSGRAGLTSHGASTARSGPAGMKQRAGLAPALAHRAGLALMDDPSGGGRPGPGGAAGGPAGSPGTGCGSRPSSHHAQHRRGHHPWRPDHRDGAPRRAASSATRSCPSSAPHHRPRSAAAGLPYLRDESGISCGKSLCGAGRRARVTGSWRMNAR